MNNYIIIDLLSVLLKRELLYQNSYLNIQSVLFHPTSIVLVERDSNIEFLSLEALYTFLMKCLPISELHTDRDSLSLHRDFKEKCFLQEPKELNKLSSHQLEKEMKVTPKKKAKTAVAKKPKASKKTTSVFLRQSEATKIYDTDRHRLKRLSKNITDKKLFYRDGRTPYYSTELLEANFEKRDEKEVTKSEKINQKLGIEVDGKEIAEEVAKVKKVEVKDFTPNDDDTGEYCQIESSDVKLIEEVEELEKALNNCEVEDYTKEENNQEKSENLLFCKAIFNNFKDLNFTKKELIKWQKRTAEEKPLTTEEKERFSVFIQATRAYTSLLKIEKKNNPTI